MVFRDLVDKDKDEDEDKMTTSLSGDENSPVRPGEILCLGGTTWYSTHVVQVLQQSVNIPDHIIIEMDDEHTGFQPLRPTSTDIIYTNHKPTRLHWTVSCLSITNWTMRCYDEYWMNQRFDHATAKEVCKVKTQKYRRKCRAVSKTMPCTNAPILGGYTVKQFGYDNCGPLAFQEVERLLGANIPPDQRDSMAIRARYAPLVLAAIIEPDR